MRGLNPPLLLLVGFVEVNIQQAQLLSIAGWLPVQWPKAILPIAMRTDTDNSTSTGTFIPIGTSFLMEFSGLNCLITVKHVVFREDGQPRTGLFMLNNVMGGGITARSFDDLFVTEGLGWIPHPTDDIAATICPMRSESDDFRLFTEDLFEDFANIREGDDIFFLGFPLQIVTPSRITPIVRGGMVALKGDDVFLIEANVFPGNSGSPVFFKPCPFRIGPSGLQLGAIRPPKLIGILNQSISYREEAVSRQTGRTRVVFEENSGLANALSVKFIRETLNSEAFQKTLQSFRERHTQG